MRPSFWPTTHDILNSLHAVRRTDRLELGRGRGDHRADLRDLHRLRARRARRAPRPRSRSTTRSTSSRTAAGWTTSRAGPRRASRCTVISSGSTRFVAITRRCTGCATSRSTWTRNACWLKAVKAEGARTVIVVNNPTCAHHPRDGPPGLRRRSVSSGTRASSPTT